MEDWQDPGLFERNRQPMTATFETDRQQTVSLSGTWKFHFNETIGGRVRGFEGTAFDDSAWGTIPVPGNWEMYGYCDPIYLNHGFPWMNHMKDNPPYPATEHNYVGQYRRTFAVPAEWKGKEVLLDIGSATSNVRVWVNGKEVGYSEDSKLGCRFDITPYVHAGENLLALEIFRWCDGTYLEDQDFWRLSGIARGVWAIARDKAGLRDIQVEAGMDGRLKVRTLTSKGITRVQCVLRDAEGRRASVFRFGTGN